MPGHLPGGCDGSRMIGVAAAVPRAIILTRQDDWPQMPCHHPDLIGKSEFSMGCSGHEVFPQAFREAVFLLELR